jgi:hypothetical protein
VTGFPVPLHDGKNDIWKNDIHEKQRIIFPDARGDGVAVTAVTPSPFGCHKGALKEPTWEFSD